MKRAIPTTLLALLTLATSQALPIVLPPALGGSALAAQRASGGEGPEVAKARQHFKAGERAFNAGDFAKALAEFEAGYQLVPRPGFLLNMAHSERRLGHAVRARELYQRYLDADPGSPQRDEILGFIAEIDRALGSSAIPGSDPSPPQAESPAPAPAAPPQTEEPVAPPPAAAARTRASPAPLPPAPPPVEDATPLISTEPSSSDPEPESEGRPLYRRWWFWTAIGVVAVGVTAGIIVGTREGGPPFHSDGTLGRVGQP